MGEGHRAAGAASATRPGGRAAGYVDAFMATINWKFADGLYARASA